MTADVHVTAFRNRATCQRCIRADVMYAEDSEYRRTRARLERERRIAAGIMTHSIGYGASGTLCGARAKGDDIDSSAVTCPACKGRIDAANTAAAAANNHNQQHTSTRDKTMTDKTGNDHTPSNDSNDSSASHDTAPASDTHTAPANTASDTRTPTLTRKEKRERARLEREQAAAQAVTPEPPTPATAPEAAPVAPVKTTAQLLAVLDSEEKRELAEFTKQQARELEDFTKQQRDRNASRRQDLELRIATEKLGVTATDIEGDNDGMRITRAEYLKLAALAAQAKGGKARGAKPAKAKAEKRSTAKPDKASNAGADTSEREAEQDKRVLGAFRKFGAQSDGGWVGNKEIRDYLNLPAGKVTASQKRLADAGELECNDKKQPMTRYRIADKSAAAA